MQAALNSTHKSSGARQATPMLSWPSLDKVRTDARAMGMTEAEAEARVKSATKFRKDVKNAALDFESHFVATLLNEMKKTVEKDPMFHGGQAEETFEEMLSHEQAKSIVHKSGGFGIATMVEQKMIRQVGAGYIPASDLRKVFGATDRKFVDDTGRNLSGVKSTREIEALGLTVEEVDAKLAKLEAGEFDPQTLDRATREAESMRFAGTADAVNRMSARMAYGMNK